MRTPGVRRAAERRDSPERRATNTIRKDDMPTTTDYDTTDAMLRFGGSFVKQLATLYRLADDDNQQRIKTAWPEYWAKYADLADLNADDAGYGHGV